GAWPAAADAPPAGPVALPATGRTLVPIGGGKDSVVALELVRRAGREALPFSVGRAEPIVRCVAASGLPHAVALRALSPNIGALNAAGAHNGHVPVTAVVSTIALMTAVLHGADAVAMANERSASEGNLVWDGLDVNHQWSKGAAFERAYRELVAAEVATGLDYRSVLRPASELAIARAFSRLPAYHPHFTSCNAVFRLDPARRSTHWCGNCPKCRFVFLALAPELRPDALRAIFGVDMLDDETQYAGFCDLAGLREHKPFECVGEEAESLAAMRLVAGQAPAEVAAAHPGAQGAWRDHAVVRRLAAEHLGDRERVHPEDLAAPYVLEEGALATLPPDLRDAAVALLTP
ncbi:endonuclease domain-containing protein, partial [Patulibacter sp. S7RM1-6]